MSSCPSTTSAFNQSTSYVLVYQLIMSSTSLIVCALLTMAVCRCRVLDSSVRAYLLVVGLCGAVSAPSTVGNTFYTLSRLWTDSVCELPTPQINCAIRLLPPIVLGTLSGFSISALSIDRFRDTRQMLANSHHQTKDRTPYTALTVITTMAIAVAVMLMGNIVFMGMAHVVIPVCSVSFIMDSPFLAPAFAPVIILHIGNGVAMAYVSRTNRIIYDNFIKKRAHQTLEYRSRLKRNIATGKCLVPVIRAVAACYLVIMIIFFVPLLCGASLATKYVIGHLMNSLFVTLNTYVAVRVLRTHGDIRATLVHMMPVLRTLCPAVVEPEEELKKELYGVGVVNMATAIRTSYEGAIYNDILNKSWM